MDEYLAKEFYAPMGLERTLYLPLRRLPKSEIIPSANDRFLRKSVLQGFVHDELPHFREESAVMPDYFLMPVK